MPTLSLPAVEGGHVEFGRFMGKPTVLNLWSTWCPPCRREMPALREAQFANPDVNIVFVNQGESGDDVQRFLKTQGLVLDHFLLDPRRLAGAAYRELRCRPRCSSMSKAGWYRHASASCLPPRWPSDCRP